MKGKFSAIVVSTRNTAWLLVASRSIVGIFQKGRWYQVAMYALIGINAIVFFAGVFVGMLMVALLQGNKEDDESVDWYGQDKW